MTTWSTSVMSGRTFFASGVAPFMLVRFCRGDRLSNEMVVYETARPVTPGRRGSAALARLDRQVVSKASLLARHYLWKTYSAGSLRDDALVARLEVEDRLSQIYLRYPTGFWVSTTTWTTTRSCYPTKHGRSAVFSRNSIRGGLSGKNGSNPLRFV